MSTDELNDCSNDRFDPLNVRKCKLCKTKVHQDKAHYCQGKPKKNCTYHTEKTDYSHWTWCIDCAYKKGICAMCGKQVLDTSAYKQSSK